MHASRRLLLLLLIQVVLCGGCLGDIRLLHYRNDELLANYRYRLGEQYLTIDGLQYCYQEMGSGPTLLIIPGLGTSVDFWQMNIPVWAMQFHVVAVDLPGFGKSDKPDVDYELDWLCDRLIDFMDAKGLKRVNVLGGSMGGHLALMLAIDHPQRIDKVIMMGATGAWASPSWPVDLAIRLLWNEWMVADFMQERWPEIFAKMFKHENNVSRQLFRYQMALRAGDGTYDAEGRASARALRSIFYTTRRHELDRLQAPLLLVWGAEDEIHPLDDAQYIREHVEQSRLVVVTDSGHEVMIEQPAIFNHLIETFLLEGLGKVSDNYSEATIANARSALLP
ncbi:MAG: 4,5:9,10-diseco-3-hydroxy-5,9,17-trioxoandrosta-1(10),2-diene-4-oate hydrolase [Phycisphaerae bacterium]|nr:4,5:9,10-diseco-3-hydroxy-5,9,17-trioxoandrosta-1(10),2-diene-4-oate hydrolase [Phycisphaerae bacterium]